MGVPPATATAAVRISIGPSTSDAEIDAFVALWTAIVRPAALAA
jgi:cysteine sulfinate desulfinase/cysteine desulfurase-like protein